MFVFWFIIIVLIVALLGLSLAYFLTSGIVNRWSTFGAFLDLIKSILNFLGTWLVTVLMFWGAIVFLSLLTSFPLYFLWNWLIPTIFGLNAITWIQAYGLACLTGFLSKTSVNLNNKKFNFKKI